MSSIATLNEDIHKPWINPRVNNLTVDGVLTSDNISFISSTSQQAFLVGIFNPNTVSTTLSLTKIGNLVTLTIDRVIADQNGTNDKIFIYNSIPSGYRPSTQQRVMIGVISQNVQLLGASVIQTDGTIVINLCTAQGVNMRTDLPFPAAITTAGIEGFSASWIASP